MVDRSQPVRQHAGVEQRPGHTDPIEHLEAAGVHQDRPDSVVGAASLSTIRIRTPRRANSHAATSPTGPAPTTNTSVSMRVLPDSLRDHRCPPCRGALHIHFNGTWGYRR
jgi:hypothetical protein